MTGRWTDSGEARECIPFDEVRLLIKLCASDMLAFEWTMMECAIVTTMKTYPNKQRYYEILRSMSPQEKLLKSFELTELVKAANRAGLRNRNPHLSEHDFEQLFLERQKACHNQIY